MDKLMKSHGMDQNCEFGDYATGMYMKGKVAYGSYWNHINVGVGDL